MARFLELHLLQNFALSNLNRDDAGAPKSCVFGGVRRSRVSSQCLKRAVRTHVREEELIPSEHLSWRTKWLRSELASRLLESGVDEEKALALSTQVLELLSLKLDKGKTEYLLMLGEKELQQLSLLCRHHQVDLELLAGGKAGNRKAELTKSLATEFLNALDGGDAVDLALFGRMVATHANKNVDAAVQMAHAFSTHAVATEFDFYAAVDDLARYGPDDGAGAGMIGTILYNSSCYYRYANVDLGQLAVNLGGKQDAVLAGVRAFMAGMVLAIPTGKRTNSAPQNLPSLVMAVVRDKGLWSLANAFVSPVFTQGADLTEKSATQLLKHWNQLVTMYGPEGILYSGLSTYLAPECIDLADPVQVQREGQVSGLIEKTIQVIQTSRN